MESLVTDCMNFFQEKEEPEVFYIFYENSDEDPKNEEKPQTVEVYTSPSQTEDDEVGRKKKIIFPNSVTPQRGINSNLKQAFLV